MYHMAQMAVTTACKWMDAKPLLADDALWLHRRYLINLDGVTYSGRLSRLMHANSVLLKVGPAGAGWPGPAGPRSRGAAGDLRCPPTHPIKHLNPPKLQARKTCSQSPPGLGPQSWWFWETKGLSGISARQDTFTTSKLLDPQNPAGGVRLARVLCARDARGRALPAGHEGERGRHPAGTYAWRYLFLQHILHHS